MDNIDEEVKPSPSVEPIEVEPSVNLVAVYDGEVVYQALVGGVALSKLLTELANTEGVPCHRQEQTLANLGQDIYKTGLDFIMGLRTAFSTHMQFKDVRGLDQVFGKHDLTMFLVVSY